MTTKGTPTQTFSGSPEWWVTVQSESGLPVETQKKGADKADLNTEGEQQSYPFRGDFALKKTQIVFGH